MGLKKVNPPLLLLSITLLLLAVSFLLSACGSLSPHENFKSIMQSDIGRSADDPSVYRKKAHFYFLGVKYLANGNAEEEYKAGRRLICRVYFEIDKGTAKIVGWRYEGTERDCVIVP